MADNSNYYPPVGFFFGVSIDGEDSTIDAQFQSVSGLSVDIEIEEYAEGGENRFKHKLPVRTKFPNLVLKRGFVSTDSKLVTWCKDAVESFEFKVKEVTVILYDESKAPLMAWHISGCFPVKWNVDEFNASESKLVIETIELSYNYFNMNKNANRN